METNANIEALYNELFWLQDVIHNVISTYLEHEGERPYWEDLPVPDLDPKQSIYASKVLEWQLTLYERLALILTIAPHIRPEVLDMFLGKNKIYDKPFTEFGGKLDKDHSGFLPTGQTLLFLITALNFNLRSEVIEMFTAKHTFNIEQVLSLDSTELKISKFNGVLKINEQCLIYFITGNEPDYSLGTTFPAQQITTQLEWEDVVLNDYIMEQVQEIRTWLTHGDILLNDWGLSKKIKPGYRSLFYGPPGTGKTLTVSLLGKVSEREVYRVDLSAVVSKYIGETEKNLSNVFDIAQHKNWILFFDEADALFGKRTQATSSNDRHANQQTSYLLQRIEDFPGVVILASNLKGNMDAAFTRRFQSMIHFRMPMATERFQLWKNAFSGKCELHQDIDLWGIAENYELAGGAIINVLRYCAMLAIEKEDPIVTEEELIEGIRKEFQKENRTITTV